MQMLDNILLLALGHGDDLQGYFKTRILPEFPGGAVGRGSGVVTAVAQAAAVA